jgi:hypothetical protein
MEYGLHLGRGRIHLERSASVVEGRILGRRSASSRGEALPEEHTYLLRRGALYGRWRVHGKEGCTHL